MEQPAVGPEDIGTAVRDRGTTMTTIRLSRGERVSSRSTRVPGESPYPSWRAGGAPPSGRDPVAPLPPGRGRGLDPEETPPWAVLVPATATCLDARAASGKECLRRIAELPPEAWVSIVEDRPLGRLRLRHLARRSGLVVERELIVLVADGAGATVVEDVPVRRSARSRGPVPRGPVPTVRLSGVRVPGFRVPAGTIGWLPWSSTRWSVATRVLLARRG